MYNRNFRVSAPRLESPDSSRKSLARKGFGDQGSTMMTRGHVWVPVLLLAASALVSQAPAQDVRIDSSSGTLSQGLFEPASFFAPAEKQSREEPRKFNLLPVQYDYGPSPYSAGPPSFQGGPSGAAYERPIPNQQMVFSGNPNERQFYSYEGVFFRTEYLNWTFQRPGDTMMGESTLVTKDPTIPFELDGFGDPLTASNFGKVSTLEPIAFNGTSGVRGVLGVPLTFGSFEGSAFGFHMAEESFDAGPIDGTVFRPFRINSLTIGGDVTDAFRPYSSSYKVNYTSKLYGAETNLIFDGLSNDALTLKPIAGFRFMNLSETMEETGILVAPPVAPFASEVNSTTLNNMYLPQAGVRCQLETKWLTFAFDPKFGLGANDYYNKVSSNNYLPGSGYLESKDSSRNLMYMVDLGLTGRIPVSEYFNVTLGYNFMWLGRVSRASDNVAYDLNDDLTNNVHVDTQLTDMVFQGASIGGEFIYR